MKRLILKEEELLHVPTRPATLYNADIIREMFKVLPDQVILSVREMYGQTRDNTWFTAIDLLEFSSL